MRKIWTDLTIDAPAEQVWELFTNLEHWSDWGPSIRGAQLNGGKLNVGNIKQGATGTVITAVGKDAAFEITHYEPGTYWAWSVAGIGATHHRVKPLDTDSCRAGFGIAWIASPYLAVCQIALHRIKAMAEKPGVTL